MTQILCHLWGDYIFQSDWMASNKTKDSRAAFIHAACYLLPFLLLTRSLPALAVMFFTHAAIDRFRLASYVVMAKNILGSPWDRQEGKYMTATGYPEAMPSWMSVWLLIIADNTLHLTINYLALRFL